MSFTRTGSTITLPQKHQRCQCHCILTYKGLGTTIRFCYTSQNSWVWFNIEGTVQQLSNHKSTIHNSGHAAFFQSHQYLLVQICLELSSIQYTECYNDPLFWLRAHHWPVEKVKVTWQGHNPLQTTPIQKILEVLVPKYGTHVAVMDVNNVFWNV